MTDDPGWDGERRMIGDELLRDVLAGDLSSYNYLVAGPPPMVEGVEQVLSGLGVPAENISADRFSGY
jgi:NAD(P)H-flavin reductase